MAALQLLPARQRAVLILRDVLGFSGGEVADALGTSRAAVDSALQRAHGTVDARLPARSQQATLRALGDAGQRALIERFTRAWDAADVDAIVELLTDDATITMPPYPSWYQGRDAIAAFFRRGPFRPGNRWRSLADERERPARGRPATCGTARRTRRTACTCSRWRATGSRAGPRSSAPTWSPRFGLPPRLQDGTPTPGP